MDDIHELIRQAGPADRLLRVFFAGLITVAVSTVFLTIPPESNYQGRADEGTYFYSATTVMDHGVGAFRTIGRRFLERRILTNSPPPPIRIAHIGAQALWLRLTWPTFTCSAIFSAFCYVALLAVCFLYARRHLGLDAALVFTALLSSAPLTMALGRRALSDMDGMLWCTAAAWTFVDLLANPSRGRWWVCMLALAMAVLVREASGLLGVVFLIFYGLHRFAFHREFPFLRLVVLLGLSAMLVVIAHMAVFGPSLAWALARTQFLEHLDAASQVSRYALDYCSGPWFRFIVDFTALEPFTLLLFIGYAGYRLASRSFGWLSAFFGTYFLVYYLVQANLKHSKVVRMVVNLEVVFALFAALSLFVLFRSRSPSRTWLWVTAGTTGLYLTSYLSYVNLFCIKGVYDPISYALLSSLGFMP